MIRVRFAPSPTGNLHIGGARTALFNWLYAKAKAGKFILRVEDTDQARSKKEYLDEILDSLKWLGLNWDEIYFQSQRLDIYREHAQRLLKQKKAYLERKQPNGEVPPKAAKPEDDNQVKEAIIFRVQPQSIKIQDLIRGEIEFDASLIKDQVLIKSDGTPTYNFACVVDDAGLWLNSMDFHDPLVKAVGKFLEVARTKWGAILFTCSDQQQVFSKLRNMPHVYTVRIIKEATGKHRQRNRRIAKIHEGWMTEDLKRSGKKVIGVDVYYTRMPSRFYNWYKPHTIP